MPVPTPAPLPTAARHLALLGAALLLPGAAGAQVPPGLPDAAASDPRGLGLMQGFPPKIDKTVRFGDGSGYKFPQLRWSFAHQRELVPTAAVWRGAGAPAALPRAERDLDGVAWTSADGKKGTWAEMLGLTYTDGILVLHRGAVVYERYPGALDGHTPHLAMSVTKSFVGLLAASLAAEGKLDPAAQVTKIIP
jgi:CubicO group peptidase (beta-lactamase class C family)